MMNTLYHCHNGMSLNTLSEIKSVLVYLFYTKSRKTKFFYNQKNTLLITFRGIHETAAITCCRSHLSLEYLQKGGKCRISVAIVQRKLMLKLIIIECDVLLYKCPVFIYFVRFAQEELYLHMLSAVPDYFYFALPCKIRTAWFVCACNRLMTYIYIYMYI